MGNCCKLSVKKDLNREIQGAVKSTVESGTMLTDDRSHMKKTLQILCNSPEISLFLRFRPTIPIQDLKEQIVSECPNLEIETYSIFRDELEVLDPTATLQQLGISAGDILWLVPSQIPEDSEDVIADECNSFSQVVEEVTSKEVASITAKKGLSSRNFRETDLVSPKKTANELWRTALPSPPARHLINCDRLDASSFTNITNDRSIKAPQINLHVKIPRVVQDSDDSNMEERRNAKENSYFQDLKGPFYMFQRQ